MGRNKIQPIKTLLRIASQRQRIVSQIGISFAAIVLIVAWQNCNQPSKLTIAEYSPTIDDTNSSLSINDGAIYTTTKNLKLNLVYPYAKEVFITTDPESLKGEWQALQSPQPYVLEGADEMKTLYVKFRNHYKKESEWMVQTITLDTAAPSIDFNKVPATITALEVAEFNMNITDGVSGVAKIECRINSQQFRSCKESEVFANLPNGQFTFEVVATDRAGNRSQPKTFAWTVDTTAPDVNFPQKPDPYTQSHSATFAFNAVDSGSEVSSYRCQLDANPTQACTSPKTYDNLASGSHTFKVFVQDAAGNLVEQSYSWFIDSTEPVLRLVSGPKSLDTESNPTFQFEANDSTGGSGLKSLTCQLDTDSAKGCNSPYKISVKDGSHTLKILATDKAGNSKFLTYSFEVDSTNPRFEIIEEPTRILATNFASYSYNITDTGSGFSYVQCEVDGATPYNCSATRKFYSLSQGSHSIKFIAYDKAGNRAERNSSFIVDTVRPTTPVLDEKPPSPAYNINISFSSTDENGTGIDYYLCQLDKEEATKCWGKKYYSLETGYHTISITAVDKAGNLSRTLSFGTRGQ